MWFRFVNRTHRSSWVFLGVALGVAVALVGSRATADMTSPLDDEARVARAQASSSVWVMESVSRRVRVILQTARRIGQARDVACADEDLSRADMALRLGRDHARRLLEDWDHGNALDARRELARLSTTTQSARQAGAEAEYCIDGTRPAEGTTVRLIIDR
jgi:hypothetical protein